MSLLILNRFTQPTQQKGSVLTFMLIMLPILIATMGVVLDIGKYFVVKSELQNAADACALAAAYELDGTATQFTRAEAAGLNLAAKNNALFQADAVAGTTVQFSANPSAGYASAAGAAASASFARCDVTKPNISNWIIQMVGVGNQTINAAAVASNVPGQDTCALPIGLCDVPPATPPGTWLEGVVGPGGGSPSPGFFKWIDFSSPAGGASELNGLLSGRNRCEVDSNNPTLPIGEFGLIASADRHYNTRFGIRAGGTPANSIPDYSGYAYFHTNWPSKFNAYPDFVANRRPVNAPYQGVAGITLSGGPTILDATQLAARGANRRVAVAPVIDCATQTFQRWACVFLLHPLSTAGPPMAPNMYLEYLGNADATGPCKSFGLAGPSTGSGPLVSALVQ